MYQTWKCTRRALVAGAAVFFLLTGFAVFTFWRGPTTFSGGDVAAEKPVIVIDAGHGGVDPGAVGDNGALEKDINLAVALCLRDILRINGYEVIMTREEDISIHDPGITKISAIKTSDLKNRLQLLDSCPDALAVSIHQNSFPQSQYHGAQMFYGPNHPDSLPLANAIQTAFRALQPDNERAVKRATSDVYIIYNARLPIVLVECGFVSNPEECRNLCDTQYQQKIAFSIFAGISAFRSDGTQEE